MIFYKFSSYDFAVVVQLRRGVRKLIRHGCTENRDFYALQGPY